MKKYLLLPIIGFAIIFTSCTNGQLSKTNLAPEDFLKKITELPNAPIIDVRTPGEFQGGHIANAKNIDWNGTTFDTQIADFDKTQPIFVYCLSGGRSGSAASQMRSVGFKEVYELNGGLMNWKSANLPETTEAGSAPKSDGMTKAEFDKLANSEKLVLFDFYAEWCGPCKKMAPFLEEISKEMPDKVTIIRIDVDKNPLIADELAIEGLPTLLLYKGNKNTWKNLGFLNKEEIEEHLK